MVFVMHIYQRFSEGKMRHSNEIIKLMNNCTTCTDNYLLNEKLCTFLNTINK